MAVTLATEKIFYNYIRKNPEIFEMVKPSFFENKDIQECFIIDYDFFKQYRQIASIQQISELLRQKEIKSFLIKSDNYDDSEDDDITINREKLEKIYEEDIDDYDFEWMKKNIDAWVQYKNLDESVYSIVKYLKSTKITAENIQDVVNTVKTIIIDRNNIDLSFNIGLDFYDPQSHYQNKLETFTTGYSWIDKLLDGGWQEKTFHIIVGPTKGGKSIFLSNFACNSIRNGFNTAVVTLELRDKKFIRRLGSNLLDIPMKQYVEMSQDPEIIREKLDAIRKGDGETFKMPGNLFIKEYPTGSASVIDIENYLRKLEEVKKMKLKLVIIDYINITKNWRNPNSEDTYNKIKAVAEDMRAMGFRNSWCVVSATQLNRKGIKSSSPDIADVAESMGLAATVDSMFTIIPRDEIDLRENEIVLKSLALRESGGMYEHQKFHIDYEHMRIIQEELMSANLDAIFNQ